MIATTVIVSGTSLGIYYAFLQSQTPEDPAPQAVAIASRPAAPRALAPPAADAAAEAVAAVPSAETTAAGGAPPNAILNADAGAAPSTPPTAPVAPSSLEDVIGRAMPAVVRVETSGGFGSGFFIAPDTILTNVHVVGANTSVTIRRPDGTTTSARVDASAPELDIAIVRISTASPNQATLPMGSGMQARPGQEIVALGTPLGLQNTVTRGIVSAVRAVNGVTLVQTDAAINPGNSGGPLVDRTGSVIGIATMGMRSAVAQGLSFGVAIEHAQGLLAGQRSTATGTPAASLNQAMSAPQGQSEADAARDTGTRNYEQLIAVSARRADDLDARWRVFKDACYEGKIVGSFEREWFALWDARAMQGAVSQGCGAAFNEVKRVADQIRAGVMAAEENARRSGVYPGAQRDIRQRHRLQNPAWDR
jgi:putative serine protease PepD